MRHASPLRYPGGKWRLTSCFESVIALNYGNPPVYAEPYAGGASLALSLLFTGVVSEIYLNDLDPAIHAFWFSILRHRKSFCELVERVPITPVEWRKQRKIYAKGLAAGRLALGFATFFLNRTNHSGILNGGMIGGKQQRGEWKLDARFNRSELIRRIERICRFKDRIHLCFQDASDFLREQKFGKKSLVYLDPPYYHAGRELYLNAYRPNDHALVRDCARTLRCPWIVSYDDVPEIRKLYRTYKSRRVRLLHTARSARLGREVMFFSPALSVPTTIQ
jgi:DNA adenine methylase